MADPSILPTAQALFSNLLSLATDEVGSALGYEKDLRILRELAQKIRSVLADAENNRTGGSDIQVWLRSVVAVAYDAELLLDAVNYDYLRLKVKSSRGKVDLYSSAVNRLFPPRMRLSDKIKDICSKLNRMSLEFAGLDVIPSHLHPSTVGFTAAQHANSTIVVGRDAEKNAILNMLMTYSTNRAVSVLPIVGMSGLGKTTMAKLVYNSQDIQSVFSKRIWVCLGDGIGSEMDIFKLILASLTGTKVAKISSSRDEIVHLVGKQMCGKRYLLVLDGLGSDHGALWDVFLGSLEGISASRGNWCLVTTHADILHKPPTFRLNMLSEDDCWHIVLQKANWLGDDIPYELLTIRSQVVKSCGGLPLAASVIGGVLFSQQKESWPVIAECLWNNTGDVLGILRLSYDFLPSPIKTCFAYCSLFDPDDVLEREFLVQLWMAEGFLQQEKMEETGGRYIDTLVQMSLFEEEHVREARSFQSKRGGPFYRMHHLVHDLALSISNRYKRSVNDKRSTTSTAFVHDRSSKYQGKLLMFAHLHVLDLSDAVMSMTELPDSIGTLKLLRFLNLSNSEFISLPKSISRLYNLQTLRLVNCFALLHLPRGMSRMISMRHLHYFNGDEKFKMPAHIRRLTRLQTLEFFNVGEKEGCGIEELGDLNDLKGKLVIRNLELVKGVEGAKRANLSVKTNLFKLELRWGGGTAREADTHVLEGLEPHVNLQDLVIRNFMGYRFPRWLGNMQNLVKLKVIRCERCKELPALGLLMSLEYLELRELEKLESIGPAFYGLGDFSGEGGDQIRVTGSEDLFPSLKTLTIVSLSNLTEWREVGYGRVFPKLENVTIQDCSGLTTIPTHFPNLKYLELSRCHSLFHLSYWATISLEILRLLDCYHLTAPPEGFSQLQSLRWLEIRQCPSIEKVLIGGEEQCLESLTDFIISDCQFLTHIAWGKLECCTSLQSLMVYDCPSLISFSVDLQKIPFLSTLWLQGCLKVSIEGFHHLASLRELRIGGSFLHSRLVDEGRVTRAISHLVHSAWPNDIQHLTSLTELWLWDYGLEALPEWIGNLGSLETLGLWHCPNLQHLPSLHAMHRLRQLQILDVYNCPLLKERCSPDSALENSEWPKISHIPNLWII